MGSQAFSVSKEDICHPRSLPAHEQLQVVDFIHRRLIFFQIHRNVAWAASFLARKRKTSRIQYRQFRITLIHEWLVCVSEHRDRAVVRFRLLCKITCADRYVIIMTVCDQNPPSANLYDLCFRKIGKEIAVSGYHMQRTGHKIPDRMLALF